MVAEIMRLVGRFEGLTSSGPEPKLRRQNQIRTVVGSLAIEGNTLGLEQATAILDQKRVIGPKREIQEVKNAIHVYSQAKTFAPTKSQELLRAHGLMLQGLANDAGRFRTKSVGIFRGQKLTHSAPPAKQVPRLVNDLLGFLRNDKDSHPLIKSAVVHYGLEFIHPFSDGNGRVGRLWQHLVLLGVHAVFEHVPVESIIHQRQAEYYRVLRACDKAGDSSRFIDFSLHTVHTALADFLAELKPEAPTATSRRSIAREHFKRRWFSRKEYLLLLKLISTATASRDLKEGVSQHQLQIQGATATARYRFR
ncbi:MAG: Fic family protein [Myxococcaceae bacterium]|nr:Fic family protein [Myxococcaceae bacterium]